MSGIETAFFGSLAKDSELKTSKAGKQYLNARVAVADGEKTQWVGVRAFDEKAIENAEAWDLTQSDPIKTSSGLHSARRFSITAGNFVPACISISI